MDISGDTITLTFNNVGKGLRTKPNKKSLKVLLWQEKIKSSIGLKLRSL
jgi:hypothetical protein